MGRRDRLPGDALSGVHVLVVDDDPDARELIRTVLEYCGALVTVVPSATAALATLERVVPDALLADLAMPERDGYWLIEQVRALSRPRGSRLPAIAVTAHGAPHSPERTQAAGFQGHLRKPIDPWEMCQLLSTLVRRDAAH